MKTKLNPNTLLWSLGIIQPASASEIRAVFKKVLDGNEAIPSEEMIAAEIDRYVLLGWILKIQSKPETLFSLTYSGHLGIPVELRRLRDKTRMFLLHNARRAKIFESRGVRELELAGASPAVDASTNIKGTAANIVSGRRPKRSSGQPLYWPRFAKRYIDETGPNAAPRDTRFPYLSFLNERQLREACKLSARAPLFDMVGIAVCLGISPGLLSRILFNPSDYYRSFKLRKKGGGTRKIESPRIFLKVIQGFIADYILNDLRIHRSVHSYLLKKSIISNASQHEGKRFVANIDIENFFGSVSEKAVKKILRQNEFHKIEADLISRICTKNDHLPQGAPTSPILSNAVLFDFDKRIHAYCEENFISYTRYADDITFSGENRERIINAITEAEKLLKSVAGLKLNKQKTRIASRGGQQRVTGVVVNVQSAPPRELRRRVRSMFHNAKKLNRASADKVQQMDGYINYLNSFPKYNRTPMIEEYRLILSKLRNLSNQNIRARKNKATRRKNRAS